MLDGQLTQSVDPIEREGAARMVERRQDARWRDAGTAHGNTVTRNEAGELVQTVGTLAVAAAQRRARAGR